MKSNQKTLVDRLEDIVDSTHIEEVKNIVTMLAKINSFKHSVEDDFCDETIYTKISNEIQNEFKIDNYKLIQVKNDKEKLLYQLGHQEKFNYEYTSNISSEIQIKIQIFCDPLSEFQKLTLNTYFNEIIHLIYIQFVLRDLKRSTITDPLTGLKNRLSFNEEMKEFIPLALRENMNIGVLLINIDRFTAVNDEHGNDFGDKFLRHYAETIKKVIRSSDIAVRFSGGEFLVLLVNVETEDMTLKIAHKIKDILAETYLLSPNNDKFQKTVCIGVSMFPHDSNDIHEVVKKSEIALSDARDSGRNRVLRFKESIQSPIELF